MMKKKVLVMLALAGMSVSVMAGSRSEMAAFNIELPGYQLWCLNHMVGKDTCTASLSYTAKQTSTIIFYVNRYLEGTTITSDPLHIDCNSVPVILHRGASYTCTLPAGGVVTWKGEPNYIQNGIEGGFVLAE